MYNTGFDSLESLDSLEHEWIIFPETAGNVIIPTDESSYFSGGLTTNQMEMRI